MRCLQCGCDYSAAVGSCPGCGGALIDVQGAAAAPRLSPFEPTPVQPPVEATEEVPAALGYATMGERFLAFLCDASVESTLLGCLLIVSYSKSSLDFEALRALAVIIVPIAYMTLWEVLFHRTIGKRLLRIQLRADSPGLPYPSPFRILLRESVGKTLSGFIFGIGFLAGTWNPKKKTWADRMANTVVVKVSNVGGGFKVVLAIVLICADIGLSIAVTEIPGRLREHLVGELRSTELKIDDLHEKIFVSFFWPEPQSPGEYQRAVAILTPKLDEYVRLLAAEQELVRKSRKLIGSRYPFESKGLEVYEKVIRLRQEIASLMRRHLQLVSAFDPQKQTWNELLQDRGRIKDEINLRNNQINMVGGMYVPHSISFQSAR